MSNAPGFAYIEILPIQAQAILDLMALTQVFRDQAERAGLASPFRAVTVGLGRHLPAFRLFPIPFPEELEPSYELPVLELPADFDEEAAAATDEYRIERHFIELDATRARFGAHCRYGGDEFTTADLDKDLLQILAHGRTGGIPLAIIQSANPSTTLN